MLQRHVLRRLVHPPAQVVLVLELGGLGGDEAEHHGLAPGHEPQRLEAARAGVVEFQQQPVGLDPGEHPLGDGLVAAFHGPGAAVVAPAHMHAGDRASRLGLRQDSVVTADRLVQRLLGRIVSPARPESAEHVGVAQGVELDIGGAVAGLALDLGLVELHQVRQEGVAVGIAGVRGVLTIEAGVHGGARHGDLERPRRMGRQVPRLLGGEPALQLQPTVQHPRGNGQVPVGLVLAGALPYAAAGTAVVAGHEADGRGIEAAQPALAPELAVGIDLDARLPLELQDLEDSLVLGGLQRLVADLAALVRRADFQQGLRTQQTADVIGLEARHRRLPLQPTSAAVEWLSIRAGRRAVQRARFSISQARRSAAACGTARL